MTIKRRLFISNILMLIMPIILTMLMFACIILILMGVTGNKSFKAFQKDNIFYSAMSEVDKIVEQSHQIDLQNLQLEVDNINEVYERYDVKLAIYESENLIYPSFAENNSTVEQALLEKENCFIVKNGIAIYTANTESHVFVLTATDFSFSLHEFHSKYVYLGVFVFVFAIVMVFTINRLLTRFVTKKITKPIDILSSGVHEIRDGNLDYRIQYDHNDEFKVICEDFNEMALRLSHMVNARQKDEESRKELIAGISHDLRTPLTSIKAYIEGIEKGVASTPQLQKKYIDTIKSKTDDMEHTIRQLFLFSKLDIDDFPFQLENINIGELLTDFSNESVDEYKEKGLFIQYEEKDDELHCNIDVVQFRSILHNILENSLKYKINDTVKSIISYSENNNDIIITIADDGPGVPSESADRLFDIFYRSDTSRNNPGSGSGLGLAISKKMIERLEGSIYAKNVPSGGLAVVISLPKARDNI